MRGIRLRDPVGLDTLAVEAMDDPGEPGPGEVRVRVRATSLNFHDLGVVTGRMGAPAGRIPMADAAGEVEAVGPGVTEFAKGDHVVSVFFPDWQDGGDAPDNFARTPGDGIDGYAREAVVAPATWFTRAPEGWSDAEAATITTAGVTAWRALVVDGGLKPGDTVLALGTGGVSIWALQLARAAGARVIVTSSSDDKLARARDLGAEQTLNYRTTPDWGAAVREMTGGRGADIVVEVGGPGTLAQSIEACRTGGHIALIGVLTGARGDVPTAALMRRQQTLKGLIVGSRAHQAAMVRGLDAAAFRPAIDSVYPLEDLADAFRHEAACRHFGKIVVEV